MSGDCERVTMYHDGACPICAREVEHYRRLDTLGRVRFVDVREADGELAARGVAPGAALRRLHVRDADGRILTGARAFVAVWAALPGWRRLVPIASRPPVIWALEAGYRLIGPVRRTLSSLLLWRGRRR